MKVTLGFVFFFLLARPILAQTQIVVTNPAADSVLKGKYDPARYRPVTVMNDIGAIIQDMIPRVSRDSLVASMDQAVSFYNRNTGSDTVSNTRGIGAARRWGFGKLRQSSLENGERLLVSYLQFNQSVCNVSQHRCVLAVLPGNDPNNHDLVVVEGHLDSRCEGVCDITCKANGADDNAGAVALVLELARVLSKYTFNQTIAFMLTTGEEQGLWGGKALSQYCVDNKIAVRGVLNNDVVSGIICGPHASAPGCTTPGGLDSTHVRVFSADINFSMNKALGRFIKGQYEQWLKPRLQVPMDIVLMDPADRQGRGSDHQPFSAQGFAAIRFCESFEYGDGTPLDGGRQHTTLDVLWKDLNGNGKFDPADSLFVNYDYLLRNTLINGVGLVSMALGPQSPDFDTSATAKGYLQVSIKNPTSPVGTYKVAVRVTGNDFAVVYTLKDSTTFILPNTKAGTTYYIAVSAVDAPGDQSLYSQEKAVVAKADGPPTLVVSPMRGSGKAPPRLLPAHIFPDRITWNVAAGRGNAGETVMLRVADASGRTLRFQSFRLQGENLETTLSVDLLPPGRYEVFLEMHGKIVSSQPIALTAPAAK